MHAVKVIVYDLVADAVGVHHSRTTQLQVGGVHFPSDELVQRLVAREQDGRAAFLLNHTVAQADEVRSDADASASDVRQGEGRVVGPGRFPGNGA